jgi:hypothetical protein
MAYDAMKDVVVKAGIRDTMIADLRAAMENVANWPAYAAKHEHPDDVAGVQEYAEMALRRFKNDWSKL